jgi:hypothetical protein
MHEHCSITFLRRYDKRMVGDYLSLAEVIDESMKTNDNMPDFVLNRIYEFM